MHISLDGQAILVTGSSRGIGRELAISLANSGAQVCIHYNTSKQEAEALAYELGPGCFALQANLEDPDAVERLFSQCVDRVGKVTGLINNAAVALSAAPDSPQWLEFWQRTMDINAQAAALLSMLAVAHFKEYGGGRLVHMASRAAHRGDTVDYLAYAASKAALVALSKSLARAYGKDNIQSFALAPGFVNTAMAQDFMEQYGEEYLLQGMALDQMTRPEHLAPLTTLILSGMMDHATGQTFDLNAGSYLR
ncbi:MAG: SDR family NAD(P)-dependent oxidoreductase [Flavobacteriales bacterium]